MYCAVHSHFYLISQHNLHSLAKSPQQIWTGGAQIKTQLLCVWLWDSYSFALRLFQNGLAPLLLTVHILWEMSSQHFSFFNLVNDGNKKSAEAAHNAMWSTHWRSLLIFHRIIKTIKGERKEAFVARSRDTEATYINRYFIQCWQQILFKKLLIYLINPVNSPHKLSTDGPQVWDSVSNEEAKHFQSAFNSAETVQISVVG